MKKLFLILCILLTSIQQAYCWGFYAHTRINYYAVFLLPPEMLSFYKRNIDFISEHAVDPDKRRYISNQEAPRHYIDIDHYGTYPYNELPHNWDSAVHKFSLDTLMTYGISPWYIQRVQWQLTDAFKQKDYSKILRLSADIGHYIADAHVPLHACSNHNGQYTDQRGIHGFWESRVPELLASSEWDFFIGRANYINNPGDFMWERIAESAAAADTVLKTEQKLSQQFTPETKYAFENRNGTIVKQYSSAYTKSYNQQLNGMIERRMRQAIYAVASFWYTAWVNAGQPDLSSLQNAIISAQEVQAIDSLNTQWLNIGKAYGRDCE